MLGRMDYLKNIRQKGDEAGMIRFILGLMIGGLIGIVIMACLQINK